MSIKNILFYFLIMQSIFCNDYTRESSWIERKKYARKIINSFIGMNTII
jgi:hypothetical protein